MPISSAIAQLRTTDLVESIRFYTMKVGLTLEFQYENFYAGIRAGNQLFHLKLVDHKDPLIDFRQGRALPSLFRNGRCSSRRRGIEEKWSSRY
jgi:hypothetical protein